ncbi:MAG: LysR family transcriptional regulator [Alphaproteobacteria bacterium]|nr:LysR family transcriptional regulator [Alphaproteobacteria bacterium]
MEMRHLRAFLVVAEELHFTRAARRLRIAQPAVSAAIQELEQELGAQLFARTSRRVALTEAGERFRLDAEAALATLERGAQAARRVAAGETGRVVLQFTTLAALSPLPSAIARFRAARPDVQVLIEQRGTSEQLKRLRAGEADLAFTVTPGPLEDLASETLTQGPLVAILPAGHACAGRPHLRFSEIASEPMLILPERSEPAMHAAYRALCEAVGAPPRVDLELEQIDSVLAFVAAGLGISLAPAAVRQLQLPGVAYVPLHPPIAAGITVVWDAERLSPAAAALLGEVRGGIQVAPDGPAQAKVSA